MVKGRTICLIIISHHTILAELEGVARLIWSANSSWKSHVLTTLNVACFDRWHVLCFYVLRFMFYSCMYKKIQYDIFLCINIIFTIYPGTVWVPLWKERAWALRWVTDQLPLPPSWRRPGTDMTSNQNAEHVPGLGKPGTVGRWQDLEKTLENVF